MNDDLYKLLKWQWDHRHPASPFVFCHMNPKSKLYGKPYVARWESKRQPKNDPLRQLNFDPPVI